MFESLLYTLFYVKEEIKNIFILDIADHNTMCVFASIGTHVAKDTCFVSYDAHIWGHFTFISMGDHKVVDSLSKGQIASVQNFVGDTPFKRCLR